MAVKRMGHGLDGGADGQKQRGIVGDEFGRAHCDPQLGIPRQGSPVVITDITHTAGQNRAAMHPFEQARSAEVTQVAPDCLHSNLKSPRKPVCRDVAVTTRYCEDCGLSCFGVHVFGFAALPNTMQCNCLLLLGSVS